MPPYEALLADATRLPATDRLRLIDAIWDTLPDDALPPLSDEWTDEIRRRSAAYDAGAAVMVPWEQVKADALRRAGGAGSDATR